MPSSRLPSAFSLCRASTRGSDNGFLKEFLPFAGLIKHQGRIDDPDRVMRKRRVDLAAGRNKVAAGENLLRVGKEKIVKQNCRVRMRCIARQSLRRGARDCRRKDKPVERRTVALGLLGEEAVGRKRKVHFSRGDKIV